MGNGWMGFLLCGLMAAALCFLACYPDWGGLGGWDGGGGRGSRWWQGVAWIAGGSGCPVCTFPLVVRIWLPIHGYKFLLISSI